MALAFRSGLPLVRGAACVAALGLTIAGCETRAARDEAPEPPLVRAADSGFNADSAMVFLEHQVALGPRAPGTDGHRRCGAWIEARLLAAGAEVHVDAWTASGGRGETWPLRNIVARLGPPGNGRLLFVAHWDTRPWADQDPDSSKRDLPIPGANDGASGTAVLLELARVLGGATLPRGVDLLFADGEDLGTVGDPSSYCLGSRRYAAREAARYWRVVVVDMVGDRDLSIPMERTSAARAPEAVDWVWQRATAISPHAFPSRLGSSVYDDHVPFLDAGIPAVDLIDFDYPHWHTLADDLDAVDARSLGDVGRVLLDLALRP